MNRDNPINKQSVVYSIPGMDKSIVQRDLIYKSVDEKNLLLDAYLPPSAHTGDPLPGVIFIHGGPVAPEQDIKESGQYQSWGKLAAASSLVGFTFNHRYFAPGMLEQSAQDVVAAIAYIRAHAKTFNLDPNRLCLWTCSGGGQQICFALREQPVYIQCMVLYYTLLDLRPIARHVDVLGETVAHQYSPVVCLQDKPLGFPVFIARAGLDQQTLNQTLDSFITQALQANTNLEVMTHSQGHHGFDIVDDDPRSQQIIARTLAFIRENV